MKTNYSSVFCFVVLLVGGGTFAYVNNVSYSTKDTKVSFKNEVALFNSFKESLKMMGGQELRIGETEFLQDQTEKILRFDAAGYWVVPSPQGDIYVYLAYWGPGKQNIREIAFHTPDHCWVNAGWKRQDLADAFMLSADGSFETAKQRFFKTGGSVVAYVAFWHIFDSQIIDYGNRAVPSDWSLLTSLWKVGLSQRKAQWFVRIHSQRPLRELQDAESMKAVSQLIDQIAPMGRVLSLE
jgi:hypothetical protein